MPAPTLSRPAPAAASQKPATQNGQPAPAIIPFTRAARKKSRLIGQIGPQALTTNLSQVAPIQIPANGYLRSLTLDVTLASTGNSATVAFQNDAPFNVLQNVSLQAANGDSLINPLDGFALAMVTKYGCFGGGIKDPLADPTYSKVTGSGATGGSAHFQVEIPLEVDPRDALCALPNMAANQSFLLQLFFNTIAQVYSTAPTAAPTITVQVTANYWAAPAATNSNGVPQQTAPRVANAVSLIQTQQPNIAPGTDQQIQLLNVGNTVRWLMFILRNSSGVRDSADWPAQFNLLVNNDYWYYKTLNNWQRQMALSYGLFAGVSATPAVNALDAGVYILTDFMDDGADGGLTASSSQSRDLMLVTASATALYIEANTWGASASTLNVISNSLRIPDPSSFYAPLGV